MDTSKGQKLYLISYLITNTENKSIVGYSNLAARIIQLKEDIRTSGDVPSGLADELDQLVVRNDDGTLDWSNLQRFLEKASSSQWGSMYLRINSEKTGPDRWDYEIESVAPEAIIENNLKEGLSDRAYNQLKHKVESTIRIDDDDLVREVYRLA